MVFLSTYLRRVRAARNRLGAYNDWNRSARFNGCLNNVRILCLMTHYWHHDFLIRKLEDYQAEYHFVDGGHIDICCDDTIEKNLYSRNSHQIHLIDNATLDRHIRLHGRDSFLSWWDKIAKITGAQTVLFDVADGIMMSQPTAVLKHFSVVIKGQGLPRDRDLLNWESGVLFRLDRDKNIKKRSQEYQLSKEDLKKIHVGFDIGAAAYCDWDWNHLDWWPEFYDAFFVGAFDNWNRVVGMNTLKNKYHTVGWLVDPVQRAWVVGLEEWGVANNNGMAGILQHDALYEKALKTFAHLFRGPTISPQLYELLGRSARIMPAFSGCGELGLRTYQALAFGRALVAENLDYIESVYPFQDGHNYIRVSDRLEDLEEKVRWLLENPVERNRIAHQGWKTAKQIYQDTDAVFEKTFLKPLGLV